MDRAHRRVRLQSHGDTQDGEDGTKAEGHGGGGGVGGLGQRRRGGGRGLGQGQGGAVGADDEGAGGEGGVAADVKPEEPPVLVGKEAVPVLVMVPVIETVPDVVVALWRSGWSCRRRTATSRPGWRC